MPEVNNPPRRERVLHKTYGMFFNINGGLIKASEELVEARAQPRRTRHRTNDELEVDWGDGVLTGEGQGGPNLNAIFNLFKEYDDLGWIGTAECHLTLAQAEAVRGLCRARGIVFTYSGGVPGTGLINPRAETAGVAFYDRLSHVEIVETIGDKPSNAIEMGRALLSVIRYVADPTTCLARIVGYMPQPGLPKVVITTAWANVTKFIINWLATDHKYNRRLLLLGDLNAEPPDVVRARHKPDNTRKTAETMFKTLVDRTAMQVISLALPTHFQDYGPRGGATQQRAKRKSARAKRDANAAAAAMDPDDPAGTGAGPRRRSQTAIDCCVCSQEALGTVAFAGTTPPIDQKTEGNYHRGLRVQINILIVAGSAEKKERKPKLSKIAYPGTPTTFQDGVRVEGTGWKRFKEAATPVVLDLIAQARSDNAASSAIVNHILYLLNDIALDILEEESKKNPSLSLGHLFTQADAWKTIAEAAQSNVDANKGVLLGADAFADVEGGQPEDVEEIKDRRPLHAVHDRDAISNINKRAAERIAAACAQHADAALKTLLRRTEHSAVMTINKEVQQLIDTNAMSFITRMMKIIKRVSPRKGGAAVGMPLMSSIRPNEDPTAEAVSGTQFVSELERQLESNLRRPTISREAVHYLISITKCDARATPPPDLDTLRAAHMTVPNYERRMRKCKVDTGAGLSSLSTYVIRHLEPEAAHELCRELAECVLADDLPDHWGNTRAVAVAKPRKDPTMLRKGQRIIYVCEQDQQLAFGLFQTEYERVGRAYRTPLNTGWIARRTPTGQTIGAKSHFENAIEMRDPVGLDDNDKQDFFLSIVEEVATINAQHAGTADMVNMQYTKMSRGGVASLAHAYGKSEYGTPRGVGTGEVNGTTRAILVCAPCEALCQLTVAGVRLPGPPGRQYSVSNLPQADDNISPSANYHGAQVVFDQEALSAEISFLEHGIAMGKTQATHFTITNNTFVYCTDITYVMPGTRGGPQRVIECAKEIVHMGHTFDAKLAPDEMERQINVNIAKMVSEMTAFHAHTGGDWGHSVRMIAIGGTDYKSRATPIRRTTASKSDAIIRKGTRRMGFILATTPRAVTLAPTSAGGLGHESSLGATTAAPLDECLRALKLASGEPAHTTHASRVFRVCCRSGWIPKLRAPSVFDMPPQALTGKPCPGFLWDHAMYTMKEIGVWWKPSGLRKYSAIDVSTALIEQETEGCPYPWEIGIRIPDRLKSMGFKFAPDDLYKDGRVMFEGEFEHVYAGDDFSITVVDQRLIRDLIQLVRRAVESDERTCDVTTNALRARWRELARTLGNGTRPELTLAMKMNSPHGSLIHTIASAARRPSYAPSPTTLTLAPDEWHVRTVKDEWCGRQGTYLNQQSIDKLLRKVNASDEERRRITALQDEAVLVPQHFEANARDTLGNDIVDAAYDPVPSDTKSACLIALLEHMVLDYAVCKNYPLDTSNHVPFDEFYRDRERRAHTTQDKQTAFPTRQHAAKQKDAKPIQLPSADLPESMKHAGLRGVELTAAQVRIHSALCELVNFDPEDHRLWKFSTLGRTNTYTRHPALINHPILRLFVRSECAETDGGEGMPLVDTNGNPTSVRVRIAKSELDEYEARADKQLIAEMGRVMHHGNVVRFYCSDGSLLENRTLQNTSALATGVYAGPSLGALPTADMQACIGFGVHYTGKIDYCEIMGTNLILDKELEEAEATHGLAPVELPDAQGIGSLTDSDSCLGENEGAWRARDGDVIMNDQHVQLLEHQCVVRKRLLNVYNRTLYQIRIPGHGDRARGQGGTTPMMYADATAKAATALAVHEPTLLSRCAPFLLTSLANHNTPIADGTSTTACTPGGAMFRFIRSRTNLQLLIDNIARSSNTNENLMDDSEEDVNVEDNAYLLLATYNLPMSTGPMPARWWQAVLDLTMQGYHCRASVIPNRPNALAIITNLVADAEISHDWYTCAVCRQYARYDVRHELFECDSGIKQETYTGMADAIKRISKLLAPGFKVDTDPAHCTLQRTLLVAEQTLGRKESCDRNYKTGEDRWQATRRVLCGRLPRPGPETAKYIAKANAEYTPPKTEAKDKGRGAKKSEAPEDEEEEAKVGTLESRIAMIITKACGIIAEVVAEGV